MTIHSSGKAWVKHVRLAAEELDSKFKRSDWTSTYPGHDPKESLAVDLMVSDRELGNKIAEYAWSNRKRLGIRYVIWYGRIISETNANHPNVWLRYFDADNPNPSRSHKNHVHISFYSVHTYSKPAKSVTMWTTKDGVKGYKLNPVRVTQVRQKGFKLVGKIVTLSDGKYLKTKYGTHYPYDSISTENPNV